MRLEPLYRVTFSTPESWSVRLDGEDGSEERSFLIAEGRSLDEAAQLMEKTPGAIRALVHRGKCKLQEQLDRSALWLSQGR